MINQRVHCSTGALGLEPDSALCGEQTSQIIPRGELAAREQEVTCATCRSYAGLAAIPNQRRTHAEIDAAELDAEIDAAAEEAAR